jgi:cytochrome c5
MLRIAIPFMLALLAPPLAAAQSNEELMKKGGEAVGRACQACHGNIVRMLQVEHRSAEQWKNTIYSMIARGAHIFPDEIDPLIAYLAANYGPSNVPARQPSAGALPQAEGKVILERACRQCHSLEIATKKGARDWNTVVGTMATYGAMATPAEQKTLVEYLQKVAP